MRLDPAEMPLKYTNTFD